MGGGDVPVQAGMKRVALMGLALVVASVVVAEERKEERKGEIPEVTIRAEQKEKLKSEKPALNLPMDEIRELKFWLETTTAVFRQEPAAWKARPPHLPRVLSSPLAVVPATSRFSRDPVAVFHPLSELMSVVSSPRGEETSRWRYEVADSAGQRFRAWTGGGLPPKEVIFDGRSDDGVMLRPGLAYAPVLTYMDGRGTFTVVGQPLKVEGIRHQEPDALYLRLDPRVLWETSIGQMGEALPALTPAGLELLQEAADWVKRLYHRYPFELRVHLPRPEAAQAAAKTLRDHLANLLRKVPEDIPATGSASPASEARVEICVKNR